MPRPIASNSASGGNRGRRVCSLADRDICGIEGERLKGFGWRVGVVSVGGDFFVWRCCWWWLYLYAASPPDLPPRRASGRAETPPRGGRVPRGAAGSGRMRPRGGSTPSQPWATTRDCGARGGRGTTDTPSRGRAAVAPAEGVRRGAEKGNRAAAIGREQKSRRRMPRRGRGR